MQTSESIWPTTNRVTQGMWTFFNDLAMTSAAMFDHNCVSLPDSPDTKHRIKVRHYFRPKTQQTSEPHGWSIKLTTGRVGQSSCLIAWCDPLGLACWICPFEQSLHASFKSPQNGSHCWTWCWHRCDVGLRGITQKHTSKWLHGASGDLRIPVALILVALFIKILVILLNIHHLGTHWAHVYPNGMKSTKQNFFTLFHINIHKETKRMTQNPFFYFPSKMTLQPAFDPTLKAFTNCQKSNMKGNLPKPPHNTLHFVNDFFHQIFVISEIHTHFYKQKPHIF